MAIEVERSKIHSIRWTDEDGDSGKVEMAYDPDEREEPYSYIKSKGSFLSRDETRRLGELLIQVADEGWGS